MFLHRNSGYRWVYALLTLLILGGVPVAPATAMTGVEMQAILDESIMALLTGQPFSPALEQQQAALRKSFEAGAVSKARLIAMVEKSMMPMLDAHQDKTTVDNFQTLPGRVEALLSPHMSWEEVKAAGWRIATPLIHESIKDLLTGRPFSPDLEKKQLVVRKMFEAGLITKPEAIAMVEGAMLPILEHHRTSRYILQEIPERVEALLAPYMTWEEVEAVAWKMGASLIPDGQQMVLTIGTLAPPGTPWINIPETVLLPRIAKLSDNKVVVKVYGGGVMGEDTEILDKMDAARLDGCGCTALGILKASPELSTLLMPGLFNNYDEVDYIYEKFEKKLDMAFEDKGYILVALLDTGDFYLFSKNKINSLADLKKQRALTWFGAPENALFEALGINATHVSVPEVVSALSMGQADTNLAPAAWMLGMQAYQYMSFYYNPPLLYSPTAVFVSGRTPDRVRKQTGMSANFAINVTEALVNEIRKLEPEWKEQIRSYEEKSLKAFETKCGIKAMTFSAEDQKIIKKANSIVEQKIAGRVFPENLLKEIKKALAEYRQQN